MCDDGDQRGRRPVNLRAKWIKNSRARFPFLFFFFIRRCTFTGRQRSFAWTLRPGRLSLRRGEGKCLDWHSSSADRRTAAPTNERLTFGFGRARLRDDRWPSYCLRPALFNNDVSLLRSRRLVRRDRNDRLLENSTFDFGFFLRVMTVDPVSLFSFFFVLLSLFLLLLQLLL